MDEPQSRSERLGAKRNRLFLREIEPRFLGYSVPSLVTVATELFRHIIYLFIYLLFIYRQCLYNSLYSIK